MLQKVLAADGLGLLQKVLAADGLGLLQKVLAADGLGLLQKVLAADGLEKVLAWRWSREGPCLEMVLGSEGRSEVCWAIATQLG